MTAPRLAVALALVTLPLVTEPSEAFAQRSNYESVLFGERAQAMGGATMALADELSAVFYNPAGLAQLDYDVLGLSVQTLGGVMSAGEGLVRIGDAVGESSGASFGAFPTSAAYAFPVGKDSTFALSAVVPVIQNVLYSQGLSAPDGGARLIVESAIQESELLIGPSYAVRVGRVHFGASAYVEYGTVAFESSQAVTSTDAAGATRQVLRSRKSDGLQVGVTGVFGMLVRFDDQWSAGLRLRFPNLPLYSSSDHTFLESTGTVGQPTEQQTMLHGLQGTMRYPHPFGFGLGTAYRSRRIHVALDARAYVPTPAYELFGGEPRDGWDPTLVVPDGRFVTNVAFGTELFLTPRVSVLAGVHTDAAAAPSDTPLDVAGATTMSFLGVTVGSRFLSAAGTFTASIGARHGQGSISSVAFDPASGDLRPGEPGTAKQTSGVLSLSWTRSLSSDWASVRKQLNTLVGAKP